MLGAIYIGLGGMDAFSQGLRTISGNVSNLNTDGFKTTKIAFEDIFGSGGIGQSLTNTFGESTGNGVRLAPIVKNFSQGDLRQTDNDLDLAIQGAGFLTLLKSDGETYYARTGSFALDKEGYIAERATGYRLAVLDAGGQAAPVNLSNKQINAPTPTSKIAFSDNLSSSGSLATVSNIVVYDDRGGEQVWTATFTKTPGSGSSNQWDVKVTNENNVTIATSTLAFIGSVPDPTTNTMVVSTTPVGASPLSVTLDFSKVTSFSAGSSSTLNAAPGDGVGLGSLSSVTVDEAGQIKLTYSNSRTELMGPVALADLQDLQQLRQVGQGLYKAPENAPVRLAASNTNGLGTLTGKSIESSNVNLSAEFGDLILIQRGFQACSQVVSVSNDMIQQLFAIRGQ